MKTIGICSDHAGFEWKGKLLKKFSKEGWNVVDFGTGSEESCDYADYAHPLAFAVEKGEVDCGIAICGTGNGMAITLNKHQGVRAGLAWDKEIGALVAAHNKANVLVLPARFISYRKALSVIRAWMETPFEGGRHERRIAKMPVR